MCKRNYRKEAMLRFPDRPAPIMEELKALKPPKTSDDHERAHGFPFRVQKSNLLPKHIIVVYDDKDKVVVMNTKTGRITDV